VLSVWPVRALSATLAVCRRDYLPDKHVPQSGMRRKWCQSEGLEAGAPPQRDSQVEPSQRVASAKEQATKGQRTLDNTSMHSAQHARGSHQGGAHAAGKAQACQASMGDLVDAFGIADEDARVNTCANPRGTNRRSSKIPGSFALAASAMLSELHVAVPRTAAGVAELHEETLAGAPCSLSLGDQHPVVGTTAALGVPGVQHAASAGLAPVAPPGGKDASGGHVAVVSELSTGSRETGADTAARASGSLRSGSLKGDGERSWLGVASHPDRTVDLSRVGTRSQAAQQMPPTNAESLGLLRDLLHCTQDSEASSVGIVAQRESAARAASGQRPATDGQPGAQHDNGVAGEVGNGASGADRKNKSAGPAEGHTQERALWPQGLWGSDKRRVVVPESFWKVPSLVARRRKDAAVPAGAAAAESSPRRVAARALNASFLGAGAGRIGEDSRDADVATCAGHSNGTTGMQNGSMIAGNKLEEVSAAANSSANDLHGRQGEHDPEKVKQGSGRGDVLDADLEEDASDDKWAEMRAELKETFGAQFWPYRLQMQWRTCSEEGQEARVKQAHWRRVHRFAPA
jgi:hypothetical protein